MKKVFVSHIALDEKLALELRKWIESVFKGKCEVFVSGAFAAIKPGDQWVRQLRKGLFASELVLVICTKKSMRSRWVMFEAGSAWGRDVPILPICSDDHVELPVLLGQNQALHFSQPEFSKALIKSLEAIIKLSAGPYPGFNKMTNALQAAYRSVKLDSDIIDRIKRVKTDKKLRAKESTPESLAHHFRAQLLRSTAELVQHAEALIRKGYLKRIDNNPMVGPYYSLTPKSEGFLL